MRSVTDPKQIERAWNLQYAGLARQFSSLLPPKKTLLVEIGCGKGQLTIPLARQTENLQIIAIDSYRRPYSRKDHTELISALERERLKRRVRVVVSDHSHWLSRQPGEKFGGVISSEFLPRDRLN